MLTRLIEGAEDLRLVAAVLTFIRIRANSSRRRAHRAFATLRSNWKPSEKSAWRGRSSRVSMRVSRRCRRSIH